MESGEILDWSLGEYFQVLLIANRKTDLSAVNITTACNPLRSDTFLLQR